ncbi:MAG: hypothetical protein KDD31_06140 [Muricauda sp.]|nr:hypothetical protein [Allomuricauda sp.]
MKVLNLISIFLIVLSVNAQGVAPVASGASFAAVANPLVDFGGTFQIRTLNASNFLDETEDGLLLANSPFLFKEWRYGRITLNSGDIYSGRFAFDTFSNEMLYKDMEQNKTISLYKNIFKEIIIDDMVFVAVPMNGTYSIFQDLTPNNDTIKLLKLFKSSIQQSTYNPVIHSKKELDRFVINASYFIQDAKTDLLSEPLYPKTRKVSKYLSKHPMGTTAKIKGFVIKDEMDLIDLVNTLNGPLDTVN